MNIREVRTSAAASAVPAGHEGAPCPSEALEGFLEHLGRDPHGIAVIDDRGNELTRQRLWTLATEVAGEMYARGLAAGDVVVLCMPNWTEWMTVYLAILRAGMVPATLPITTDPESVAYVSDLVGAKAIVLPRTHRGRDFAAESAVVAGALDRLLHVLLIEGDQHGRTWRTFDGAEVAVPAYPRDMAHILFSSSTTGRSKAIAHSDTSLSAYNRGVIDRYEVTADRAIFMPSPLGHSTGFWHGARMSLLTGATLVLQDSWHPVRALELVDRYSCGITVAATPFLKDLVDAEWESPSPKLSALRVFLCGGAPVPPQLMQQAQRQLPDTLVCSIWAMSEGGATSSLLDDAREVVSTTCGRVMPGVVLETVTEEGEIAPRGTEGEIVMRTPSLFLGYIGQDELYRESFTADGYFRTGDIGIVDAEGYLRLTGRLKDLIIRGGVNISPVAIENILSGHPQVMRVAVVGSPDDRLGERICAVIQPYDEAPSMEQIVSWLQSRAVPRRLWPESLRVVEAMPETPAGKIRKNVLKEQISKEQE